ncbi:MAG TPA: hypothetical protein VE995_09110 [Gaiellaceae bacterium]|nr:hypothetical protein [Gaiellaceae bacterium]
MRAIAIGASIFLVFVAAAAGSGPATSQKALEAPRPAGQTQGNALVQQVACSSATRCAALGVSLYTEQAGTWKASRKPTIAHAGPANLRSLACPAAGRCVAVGMAGLQHVVAANENGRDWTLAALGLPAGAAPIDAHGGPQPSLGSVSCSSAGNCLAVGGYTGGDRMTHPLLVAENGGTWGSGADGDWLLPANAAKSPDPNNPGVGAGLSFVSCPAAGECTAVGSYSNRDALDGDYGWVVSESGGRWQSGAEVSLPANASTYGNLAVGASPFFGFTGLSCPSPGNCTAVGGYENTEGGEEGLILTERDGVWWRGLEAPRPAKGIPNIEPNAFETPITAVSCSAPADCSAVGWYVAGKSHSRHGLLLREQGGAWRASALALPAKAKAPGGVYLTSVACPSRGNCVAVGYYAGGGKTHGLVVRERGGTWARAVAAALPEGAAPARRSHTFLDSVTCPSKSACTAGGYYADRSGRIQGLLIALRLR